MQPRPKIGHPQPKKLRARVVGVFATRGCKESPSGVRLLRRLHPKLLHFAVEIGTLEPQGLSRVGHIALRLRDVFFDKLLLEYIGCVCQGHPIIDLDS